MSRIEDAFKRIGGARRADNRAADAEPSSTLEQFVHEPGSRHDDAPPMRLSGPQPLAPKPSRQPVVPAYQWVEAPRTVAAPTDPPEPPGVLPSPDADVLIDTKLIADYVGFVGRAVLRRKLLAAVVFLVLSGTIVAAVRAWPKTYQVQTRLLAQPNDVMSALVNPGRAIPRDAATRTAAETILRHENLISLIKQADLVNEWESSRVPLFKLKDHVFDILRGRQLTDAEKLDNMVGLLEKRLVVFPDGQDTLSIGITWAEATVAYDLVNAARRSFLDSTQSAERAAIAESISILDRSAESLQSHVNQTIEELQSRPAPRINRPRRSITTSVQEADDATASTPAVAQPSAETLALLSRLKNTADEKRLGLAKIEATRRQQLTDLEGKLATAQIIYTAGHPTILSLRQNIAALTRESPDATALRNELDTLDAQYQTALAASAAETHSQNPGATAAASGKPGAAPGARSATRQVATTTEGDVASAAGASSIVEYADPTSLKLRVELAELSNVRERANSARAELATSEAGFKYRYSVLRPAQIPRGPISPNVTKVVAAGVFASLLFAMAIAVAADIFSGRVVESWQVARQAKVPVLGTIALGE